jgi:two-component system, cell cycle response regulator DivK
VARIIIVEDDPTNARVAERVLSRMGGHSVLVTEDGDEVLARCERAEVDVVVMDISLGNTRVEGQAVDGVRLTQLIRERAPGGGPPVLVLTAHAMRGDRERLLEASGADDYIAKPIIDHRELVDRVDKLLVA